MTTIAYKNGILASDSLVTGGGMKVGCINKIFRGPKGIGGSAGDASYISIFKKWIKTNGNIEAPPRLNDETVGIYIRLDGRIFIYSFDGFFEVGAKFAAIGSGEKMAIGAMHSGKSAKDAVKIGIKLDCYSGGKVRTIKLKTL